MDVKAFAEEHKIMDKDIISTIQSEFKKYDKHLHSKVKRPEEYGIRLVEDAELLIESAYATEPKTPRRADTHKLKCRVSCRLTKRKLKRLQQAFKGDGYDTIQDGLDFIIDKYLACKI